MAKKSQILGVWKGQTLHSVVTGAMCLLFFEIYKRGF
jgi:hypothetical protein